MIFDGYGNKVDISPDGSSIFDATKVIVSNQFWFSGADETAYGTIGQVMECSKGDTFWWNGTIAANGTYTTPRMLSALPSINSIYDTAVTIGAEITANSDGSYTATDNGAIFFPILFSKGSTAEGYITNGKLGLGGGAWFVQKGVQIDPYYAINFPLNHVFNRNPSPLDLAGMLKNYIPIIGAKAAVLGDSLSEQSAGYKVGADSYGFYDGDYNTDGWFSRIARKYNMTYKVHGYGMQWWYCTEDRPNGGVKAVNSLIESGYIPDYIILEYGTNDIWTGTFGDAMDTADAAATSTVGALRYCIETLQAKYPAAKIIVIMPCMRNGLTERQNTYYDLITPILGEYGIPYVDMAHRSGIIIAMMRSDGVHLSELNDDSTHNNDTEAVKRYSRYLESELLKL